MTRLYGQDDMIPKEKKDECVARFTQNPYWRAYLDNAPESAKEYIRMEFAFSLLGEGERNGEFKEQFATERKSLPSDAFFYLYENEKNTMAKRIYKQLLYSAPFLELLFHREPRES